MFFYIVKPKRRPKTSNDTNMIFFSSYLLRSEILTSLKEKLWTLVGSILKNHTKRGYTESLRIMKTKKNKENLERTRKNKKKTRKYKTKPRQNQNKTIKTKKKQGNQEKPRKIKREKNKTKTKNTPRKNKKKQYSYIPTFLHTYIPKFNHSIIPPFHHYIIPSLYHSTNLLYLQ